MAGHLPAGPAGRPPWASRAGHATVSRSEDPTPAGEWGSRGRRRATPANGTDPANGAGRPAGGGVGAPPPGEAGAGVGAGTRARGGGVEGATLSTGTTVVGVVAEDRTVLAADRRASLAGRFVANKSARKVRQVHPTAAVALSGSVGAIQAYARSLRSEATLYRARRGEPPSMDALSTVAGTAMAGLPAQAVLGGVDGAGPRLFAVDGGGAVTEAGYAAHGSGLQVAYGVLEDALGDYDPTAAGDGDRVEGGDGGDRVEGGDRAGDGDGGDRDGDRIGYDRARSAAVEAVRAASERDTASGNGVLVAAAGTDGVTTEELPGRGTD